MCGRRASARPLLQSASAPFTDGKVHLRGAGTRPGSRRSLDSRAGTCQWSRPLRAWRCRLGAPRSLCPLRRKVEMLYSLEAHGTAGNGVPETWALPFEPEVVGPPPWLCTASDSWACSPRRVSWGSRFRGAGGARRRVFSGLAERKPPAVAPKVAGSTHFRTALLHSRRIHFPFPSDYKNQRR